MSRKPRNPARKSNVSKLPRGGGPPRFRAPREMRLVSTSTAPSRDGRNASSAKRKLVPQIRLSGLWLERLGFTRGTRFLVLADVPNQILLALVDL